MTDPVIPIDAVVNSALWAAYGDALGFITELAVDMGGVRSRAQVEAVETTIPWTRRIGGKFGVSVRLPAGCYSDDTQLRLATSRAIRSDAFDVEAFAKVELPSWLVYALGAGRGTKAAAASLAHQNRSWSTNVFSTKYARYVESGGNGGAMRIQPHVWSARDWGNPASFLPAVVRNVICTHGHPRAFVGAGFHALCLSHCLSVGELPAQDWWPLTLIELKTIVHVIEQDSEVSVAWLPLWENESKRSFRDGFNDAVDELLKDIETVQREMKSAGGSPVDTYRRLAILLGCFDEGVRGSATKTALLSAALTNLFSEDPASGLKVAANLLNTDTDSIATMAGALFGACSRRPPTGEIADAEYISSEAVRMALIHAGEQTDSFQYPDLLHWNPPTAALDYVGSDAAGHLAVAGFGEVKHLGKAFPQRDTGTVWQWLELKFGQKILAKRRERPRPLPSALLPGLHPTARVRPVQPAVPARSLPKPSFYGGGSAEATSQAASKSDVAQGSLFVPESAGIASNRLRPAGDALVAAIRRLEASRYDPKTLGETILELASRPDGYELLVSLVSRVLEAQRLYSNKPGVKTR